MSVERPPILQVKTSKNWVLPPRPKNARKAKSPDKKKKLLSPPPKQNDTPDASSDELQRSIRIVDKENYQLKVKLLSLIHDYKALRALVLSASSEPQLYDTATTARKRIFTEVDPMHELILNMNGLSHNHADQDVFDFVNLEEGSEFDLDAFALPDLVDEEIDDELDSALLSRLISPGMLETDDNLLMTSLTRSTTVSTNNSYFNEKKPLLFRFYDLPTYTEEDYVFSFENLEPHDKMSVIQEDHYNQVADFLEEKLMSNDVKYYLEKNPLADAS